MTQGSKGQAKAWEDIAVNLQHELDQQCTSTNRWAITAALLTVLHILNLVQ